MPQFWSAFPSLKNLAVQAVAGALLLGATAAAQQPMPTAKPAPPPGQPAPAPVVVNLYPGPAAPGCCDNGGHGGRGGHFILDSICGSTNCPAWTPLCHGDLTTGWTDPWIPPPDGSSGAPRQGWLNTPDGFFTREFHLFYFWTGNVAKAGDSHVGLFQFQTPLSRRLWVGIDVPVVGLTGFGGGVDTTHFGDLTVTPKVMLTETQDFSLSAGLAVHTPTGARSVGGDALTLTPFTAFWTDIGSGFSLRGGLGVEVPINDTARAALPDATLVANLAIGQTLTSHDATPFGDFTWYVSLNLRQDLGRPQVFTHDEHTFLSITPGIRTHLGNNLFFLAAYEVSLVGPRGFDQRVLAGFVKGF